MRNVIGKATIFLILAVSVPLHADLITFDSSTDLGGFVLGGSMRWNGSPGHVYMERWNDDDWMTYNQGSGIFTLNNFMLQAEPRDGYGLSNAIAAGGDIHMTLKDISDQVVYDTILYADLNGAWTTETFNIGNVHTIYFEKTSFNGTPGFWPRIDNLTINEPVPVPGAVLLGLLGLSVAGVKLRKRA